MTAADRSIGNASPDDHRATENSAATSHGLDLLVSVARSGTNALSGALQLSRSSDVHWLSELYVGDRVGLCDGELDQRFPWFSRCDPAALRSMSRVQRRRSWRGFTAAINENAVDVTRAVLNNRPGRTLIKVFPNQLHHRALELVLRNFRPRLLILRRDLVFTYISRLRAHQTNKWTGVDTTDVPYILNEKSALEYVVESDLWFNHVARLASELRLDSVWLTYSGLFATGDEVPLLESLYPGPPMDVDEHGRLRSTFQIQDRRSDQSVLEMIKAVSSLSPTTQQRLLRLPGSPLAGVRHLGPP